MQPLLRTPASAYRQVDLDARIEASHADDLTRICLEEAVASLNQALMALERAPDVSPRHALSRANGIAVHLARSVASDNPMRDTLVQFYGGLSQTIARNTINPKPGQLAQARDDFQDLLDAVS